MSYWKTIAEAIFARFFSALHPFLQAAVDGNGEKIKSMLRRFPDLVQIRDEEYGSTALHKAASWGRAGVAAILLAHGSQVDALDNEGMTPLHRAAEEGHSDVAAVLLSRHAQVDATDHEGLTPLHRAARAGHVDVAKVLLARGANVNAVDNYGMSPLRWVEDVGTGFSEPRSFEDMTDLLRRHRARAE
ncbi:MAG TPA: ankyrin repeat domain-containing protein [Candidatus Limnocylindrales bacterium]|nr:ankyrin repeat domain-containing protein [Candidatus Limnocylindrales bacterium]